ncbi:MAG TPA: hypothetical protein VFQ39_20385 [Longimicrobium sp.]|nr:hypothetical protein [Longimicrobium sp.]
MTLSKKLPLALLCFCLLGPTAARAQTICPADDPRIRALPDRYLTRDNFADHRAQVGLTGVSTSQLRALTDATDAAICNRIAALVGTPPPNWRWAAYQVGNLYFVAFWHFQTDGGQRLGFAPLYIMDRKLKQVGGFAM